MTSPRQPRPLRRPARRRKETPSSTAVTPFRPATLSLDAQRYYAFRAGVSKEELAARENTKLSIIERSIEKMDIERETFSQEAVEIASRRTILAAAPLREASLLAMLTATKERLIHEDGDPNRPKYESAPDHAIQLQAIAALSDLIESMKANVPLIDARQQTNLQQNFHPGIPGGISTEQLIRSIREEKGMALPADTAIADVDAAPLPDSIDFELAGDLAKAAEIDEGEDADE